MAEQVSFHLHSTAFFSIIWSGLIDARRDLWMYFGFVFAHRLFFLDMLLIILMRWDFAVYIIASNITCIILNYVDQCLN